MKGFFSMIAFFTRLPVPGGSPTEEDFARGVKFMPLVGFPMGGILLAVSLLLDRRLPNSIVALILLVGYIAITGGLHFDGLSDSFDALFSGRDKDRMLEIMKDSRSGTFGTLSVAIACLAYFVLFPAVPKEALLIFPVIGKIAAFHACRAHPYIRPEGITKLFSENCKNAGLVISFVAILIPLTAVYILVSPRSAILLAISAIFALLISSEVVSSVSETLGGITGDILGMICEISQISFLFIAVITVYFPPFP